MKRLSIANLLAGGSPGQAFPPQGTAALWQQVREFRRYYFAHSGEMFQYRPDLHQSGGFQQFTPVPLARELAAFSAALLFGEPATLTAREPGDQPALDSLTQANRLDELLTASSEYVAVEGAGGLRVSLDDGVPGGVVLDYAPGASTIWRERFGRFTSGGIVAFEHADPRSSSTWRLLEDHDVGIVRRRLFRGNLTRLGDAVSLSELSLIHISEPTRPY